MNSHYTYFLILAGSLLGPLALSFDKKVSFYSKWKFLFPSMLLPALFYVIWDIWFTQMGVWSFNEKYITGIKLINLPVEEVLFFFVVPYCCVFIYECIRCYFPSLKETKASNRIFQLTGILLFIVALLHYNRSYTFVTFLLNSLFMLFFFIFSHWFAHINIKTFLIAYLIILVPFLIVNGFLTALPVVLYNDSENLGIRIYTIPFEDIFYGMLLILMNIAGYEYLRNRKKAGSVRN